MKLPQASPAPPPTRHQMALMIWMAVLPTLTVLNLAVGPHMTSWPLPVRTFVLATLAVPIVIYGLMPQLHRARTHLIRVRARVLRSPGPDTSVQVGNSLSAAGPTAVTTTQGE